MDLTGTGDTDGKEPAHKVHTGGPKKTNLTEFSTLNDLLAFVLGSSESMVPTDYYNYFVVLLCLFDAMNAGFDIFHSEVYTTRQTQYTHKHRAIILGLF